MKFEAEPDLAAGIAVRAALSDTAASLPAALGAGAREEEIAAARDLALAAAAARPGWAYHRFLLGRLVHEAARAARDPSAPAAWETWATPLRLAADGAPGVDDIWSALGQVYLENWQKLSSAQRSEAIPVLRRALQDPTFVSARFLSLSAAVGRDEAMGLLPENPELLGAAADSFSRQGDLTAAAILLARRDTAERKRRASELASIEGRFRARDQNGLRLACVEWATEHPTSELDDPAGRAQAARVLELWPGDQGGRWEGDPRADLVRFFLDGRESSVSAETLWRTLDALSDVPDHVVARVKLRAGDVAGAEELAARPQNQGAPEWTLYYARPGADFPEAGACPRGAGSSGSVCAVCQRRLRRAARAAGGCARIGRRGRAVHRRPATRGVEERSAPAGRFARRHLAVGLRRPRAGRESESGFEAGPAGPRDRPLRLGERPGGNDVSPGRACRLLAPGGAFGRAQSQRRVGRRRARQSLRGPGRKPLTLGPARSKAGTCRGQK